jgi:CBS domain-containing protein
MRATMTTREKRRLEGARVADAMHAGVLTCPSDTPLRSVARMMDAYRVHSVVVYDEDVEGGVFGIVSDLDLVAGLVDGAFDTRTAGEVAASPVVTVGARDRLLQAARLLVEHATAHLVVVDPETTVPVGILSTLDVARAVAGWEEKP